MRSGYKGAGVTIASRESEKNNHGKKVAELLRGLVPEATILIGENYKDEINDFDIYTTSLSFSSDKLPINIDKSKELYENNQFLICAVGNDGEESQTAISKNNYFQSIGACNVINGKAKRLYYSSITKDIDFMSLTDFNLSSGKFDGTSCSAPVFASMCALVQCFFVKNTGRKLTNSELLNFIKDNCMDLEEEGADTKTGYGLFILPNPDDIDIKKYVGVEAGDFEAEAEAELLELKIKDDIDLKELEKFGLKYVKDETIDYYELQEKNNFSFRYITVFCHDRSIRTDGTGVLLFDLIKADMVEKVSVKI